MTETAAAAKAAARARDLNELIRYTMWAVFTVTDRDFAGAAGSGGERLAAELTDVLDQAKGKGIVTRGCYDLQGMRADADFMFWWVAPTSDELQEMYVNFRRTKLGYASRARVVRDGAAPPRRVQQGPHPRVPRRGRSRRTTCASTPSSARTSGTCSTPAERRKMLAEHGMMAREYPDVRANTVSSFALNDYEWMLAFEADELHRIVDLMRHLRGAEARRHTRVEIPFYTGRRKPSAELVASLA